jgi:type I restriction-modification system DNA methylase subunit
MHLWCELVEMLEPYKGRVYDPCCGSGGMFVQSEKFVESRPRQPWLLRRENVVLRAD